MCNPPFFDSMDKAGLNPATSFGGTAAEMVCPGGEDAFVRQMICDSLELRVRLCIYVQAWSLPLSLCLCRLSHAPESAWLPGWQQTLCVLLTLPLLCWWHYFKHAVQADAQGTR